MTQSDIQRFLKKVWKRGVVGPFPISLVTVKCVVLWLRFSPSNWVFLGVGRPPSPQSPWGRATGTHRWVDISGVVRLWITCVRTRSVWNLRSICRVCSVVFGEEDHEGTTTLTLYLLYVSKPTLEKFKSPTSKIKPNDETSRYVNNEILWVFRNSEKMVTLLFLSQFHFVLGGTRRWSSYTRKGRKKIFFEKKIPKIISVYRV